MAAALVVAAVTAILSWLAWHWARLAGNAPAGMRLYSRAVARAAVTALVLWYLGVAAMAAGYWLLPSALSNPAPFTAPNPTPLSAPQPAAPPQHESGDAGKTGIALPPPAAGPSAPSTGEEEYEFTEQPELPPSLQAVMAAALVGSGDSTAPEPPGPVGSAVALAAGDVVIQSLDLVTGEIHLLNRSAHAVDLRGWSISIRPPSGDGRPVWCNFPEGLILGPSGVLEVLTGTAAREAVAGGLAPGDLPAGRYVWTADDLGNGEVTLYDSAGGIRARLPGGS